MAFIVSSSIIIVNRDCCHEDIWQTSVRECMACPYSSDPDDSATENCGPAWTDWLIFFYLTRHTPNLGSHMRPPVFKHCLKIF